MKLKLLTCLGIMALSGRMLAGPMSYTTPVQPYAPAQTLFGPGFNIGGNVLFLTPEGDQGSTRAWGGGLNLEYYATPYIGFAGGAGFAQPTSTTWGVYSLDLELRMPFEEAHLAVYGIIGTGAAHGSDSGSTSATGLLGRLGLGVEFRPTAQFGIFSDYVYNWPSGSDIPNFSMFRLGFKVGI